MSTYFPFSGFEGLSGFGGGCEPMLPPLILSGVIFTTSECVFTDGFSELGFDIVIIFIFSLLF
jgi:hypothetical protein